MSGHNAYREDDTERLFQQEVAAVPTSTPSQGPTSPMAPIPPYSSGPSAPVTGQIGSGGAGGSGMGNAPPLNTLDEPVWDTVKRDLKRIGANLVLVVFPFSNRDQQSAALRNWDLWGPMAFTLTLAICLSSGSGTAQSTIFSLVFGVCAAGAIVLTVNVVLLGGNIGFFQSLCLLGWASIPFIGGSVSPARRALAVYPLLLLYVTMSWLAIIKGDGSSSSSSSSLG
ncbi:hypothetical protein WJX73_004227 [Symbiochloris irregularis]|uniref:Protein YIP n=1 Tax=Symbiochloris irregularis TaxID=706552 RepID=A0AAW1NZE2_9CHLO